MDHPAPPKNTRELAALIAGAVRKFMGEPLPRGVGFLHTTGSMCLFMAALQIVTGVLMAFYYTPSPDVAWESVRYVQEKVTFGRMIHGMHHWGSSAFVVLAFIHIVRVFTFAAYKGPRRWTWVVGVMLLAVVLGFGFTGYLLPWDMKAYFGTKVGTNIVGYAPVLGPIARDYLLAGPEISELTLPRFYAIHVLILPAALVGLIVVHVWLVRLFGITPPFKRDDEATEYPERFYPAQALRDSTMMLVVLSVVMLLAWQLGGNLEERADPTSTAYAPHPEWYFLGLQQLLRYFQGPYQIIGTVVIPFGFFALMLALPFIDRNPERRLARRPFALGAGALILILIVGLTFEGYKQLKLERIELAKQAKEEEEAAETAAPEPTPAPATISAAGQAGAFTADEAAAGAVLYEKLKCAGCHVGEGVGKDLNIPPAIDIAGDRFHGDWMMKYTKEVPPRRFERKNRHPVERMPDFKLNPTELRQISAHMDALRKPELFPSTGIDWANPTPEKLKLGEGLIESESCLVCHKLGSAGTADAPDLAGAGARLKPEFIYWMIKKPQSIVPGTTMEDSFADDAEIEAMTHYLNSLK